MPIGEPRQYSPETGGLHQPVAPESSNERTEPAEVCQLLCKEEPLIQEPEVEPHTAVEHDKAQPMGLRL